MRSALVFLGKCIAAVAYLLGFRRSVTLSNIERTFPDRSAVWRKRLARQSYTSLGRTFAEIVYLRIGSLAQIRDAVSVSNAALYHEALAGGRGLIVVAAHYANWEWLALGGAMALRSNFAIVRKNIQTSFTESFLEKMRLRSGNSLINAADVRTMLRTLQEGKCIALLADQAAPSESVRVSFLGTSTPTQQGPAWLALHSRARMLFAECQLTPSGHYVITFHPIEIEPSDTIESITQKHATLLEGIIRMNPAPWVWQHKRWKYS